jgi:hypothetical protein
MSMFYPWKHNRIQLYSRIGVRGEGTNITKDDKPIRLNQNLIHRMIISKTTQKLHLPHDTRFFQDSYKIGKLEPATRDNLDWFGFGY